jgi:EAL domain-containing protein (putative c-di-GMP-specific phosphodiesterase class I)
MDDVSHAAASILRLREQGVRVAIDDFGTGYSSLAYLKRFAISSLKIDRAFVRDLCDNHDDAAIVSAVLAMAQRLQLQVVAEGVETQGQLEFLRSEGCDQMQGYLLSRPMPGSQLPGWLETREHST